MKLFIGYYAVCPAMNCALNIQPALIWFNFDKHLCSLAETRENGKKR